MTDFADARERMVTRQIAARGIGDPRLLDALRAVPREAFVAPEQTHEAYADRALPIEAGQTISQPYIVALMIAAAEVGARDRVLEVGAGSGYAAAVLSRIVREVVAIERHAELVRLAATRISRLNYLNVRIVEGDGVLGWPEAAPYDAILASASGGRVPLALVDQLRVGGRLIIPLGGRWAWQTLVKLTKRDGGSLAETRLGTVRFVPLIGAE